ncbi:MAG: hypothetical protein ACLTAI_11570 [Thomasclavelia sp.]
MAKKVILLIDEYDVPFASSLYIMAIADEMADFLRSMFSSSL